MALIFTTLLLSSCGNETKNPLLAKWETPFETPPFDEINEGHYLPAFTDAMLLHNKEVDAITNNTDSPTFENTITALDNCGEILKRVRRVFSAMKGAMNSDKIKTISKEILPKLSKHDDDINMNATLFSKIKTLYEKRDELNLDMEQNTVLENYYRDFIRGGANLTEANKEKFSKINSELSTLSIQFGENVLSETNKFELVIDNKADLIGLPESAIANAAETAANKGYEGKWVFTISKPSMIPFIQYSAKRDLREKIYSAYFMKGDHNNKLDNKNILVKMVNLRLERAKLLGYNSHAEYVLDEQMAKTPSNVYMLLEKVWTPAIKRAKEEREDMQKIIEKEGNNFELASWDWWYYAEKVKKEKYNFDENEVRPYFEVNNVIKGVFGLATSLWGIQFEERNDIQKYHPEVKVFEVKEADGKHIGILYTDYFPRDSKRAGAWMDAFRKQYKKDGEMVTPIIYNVGNFSKPVGNKPALLSIDDVETLFHEFGHALHGLLSDCTYESVAGTETPRDFVEFPSQVMENWALHPEVLKTYATHYETGRVIPIELVNKIKNSSKFNQGFATSEYLAAAFLDMDWHTVTEPISVDANTFENNSMKKLGLIPEIKPRYRSTYFNHIFSGGYSSGYYSYIWSAVLDADAFAAFEKSGDVLNKDLADKYRKYILSSGGTEDAMELYKKFRGAEPGIEPLLEKRGLN
ncbi:MAG: M3 family metallopeptidase [Melioribacteraceae bacterium]|nr:M3 family metallopeptidase [Melioribacteraceae bacterium]